MVYLGEGRNEGEPGEGEPGEGDATETEGSTDEAIAQSQLEL